MAPCASQTVLLDTLAAQDSSSQLLLKEQFCLAQMPCSGPLGSGQRNGITPSNQDLHGYTSVD